MKAAKQSKRKGQAEPAVNAKQAALSRSHAWAWWVAGLVALFLGMEIYWPSVYGPFVFDDEYLPFLRPGFLQNGLASFNPIVRPLLHIGFWVNASLFGLEPFSYHAVNIVLHLVNAALMFFAIRKLLELDATDPGPRDVLAVFAAALFLVHPVNTESVAYVAGRSETQSLLFFLAAYTLFLYRRRDALDWPSSAAIIVLCGAAFLSKEHAAVLPALLLWTDVYFGDGPILARIRRNWRLYAPLALLGAAGLAVVWRVLASADSAGFALKDLPWHDYFYTQWRAIWVYLRLFFLPVGLNADYDFAISRSPLDHGAILYLAGLVGLLAAAWRYRKHDRLVLFGLAVFFLLLAPTSSIVPIKDPLAERRLYLPFLGLLVALCGAVRHWKASWTLRAGVFGAVLLVFAFLTHARSEVWGDPERLWKDTVAKSPDNSRAHFQLAMVYYQSGRCVDALREFENVARTGPRDHLLLVDWGLAEDCAGNRSQALKLFREAAALENTAHVRALIGMVHAKENRLQDALAELNEAERIDPGYGRTFHYRGNVYQLLGDTDKAIADLEKAVSLEPQNQAAREALHALQQRKGIAR